jgi:DNA-binding NarL/FixJ family response regulator
MSRSSSFHAKRADVARPPLRLVNDEEAEIARAGTQVKVLVVDDHPVIRDIVRMACEGADGLEFAAGVGDGDEALREAERVHPDVVVLDLSLPKQGGLEVARQLKQRRPGIRILALAGDADPDTIFECRRIGVEGLFEKTEAVDRIAPAIRAVARGEISFTTQQQRVAHEQLGKLVRRARDAYRVTSSLTTRELQVLSCIAEGLTTRQIATRLGLSERTIESHIAKLYSKLGARTRVQAVVEASRLGLLE